MATVRKTLDYAEGVELEEISLQNGRAIVDQAYIVKTLRSPETWTFKAFAEARKRFDEEVEICKGNALVQQRLGR